MEIMKFWRIRNVKRSVKEAYVAYAKKHEIDLAEVLEIRKPKV